MNVFTAAFSIISDRRRRRFFRVPRNAKPATTYVHFHKFVYRSFAVKRVRANRIPRDPPAGRESVSRIIASSLDFSSPRRIGSPSIGESMRVVRFRTREREDCWMRSCSCVRFSFGRNFFFERLDYIDQIWKKKICENIYRNYEITLDVNEKFRRETMKVVRQSITD